MRRALLALTERQTVATLLPLNAGSRWTATIGSGQRAPDESSLHVRLLDNLSIEEGEALLIERRMQMVSKAAKIYGERRSLRKTAQQMNISHEA